MRKITLSAPSKINLTLEILGRRPDGFHDLTSIIVSVDLNDEIDIEESDILQFNCDGLGIDDKYNLANIAALRLQDLYKVRTGAKITVSKKIPSSAGLGGGSSDAASVLIGLNKLWKLGLSIEQLLPIASLIGSDVPFFLYCGTVMTQRRGEVLRRLPPANIKYAVIIFPELCISNKTSYMFSKVNSGHYTKGALTRKLEARIRGMGDIPSQLLFNVFDEISNDLFIEVKSLRQEFSDIWKNEIYLCGAGPSLYTLVESKENATALALLLNKKTGFNAYVVKPTKQIEWTTKSND